MSAPLLRTLLPRAFGWLAASASALLSGCQFAISTPLATPGGTVAAGSHVVVVTSATIRPESRRPFVRESRRLLAEMQGADGLLGASLRFEPFGNRVWTLTAWRTREQSGEFADSPGHRRARAAQGPALTSFRSVVREQPSQAWPPTWPSALSWLAEEPAQPRP